MIAVICLAIAAALLFWPERAQEPVAPTPVAAEKPKRKRSPKNVAKK